MKKTILFSLVVLFVVFSGSLILTTKQAEAITTINLISPPDSSKMTTVTPVFTWEKVRVLKEEAKKYHIVVDTAFFKDYAPTSPFWQDSNIAAPYPPACSVRYNGPPFERWKTYYWSVRVQVDSMRITKDTIIISPDSTVIKVDTTFVPYWWNLGRPRIFFYATATLIEIPDSLYAFPVNLRKIQTGIIWAAARDTVLVKPGIYYENLIFNKKGVILASQFARNKNIATIDSTIIDGDSLTRGEEKGSVIYFTSEVNSNSKVTGFTIRNGRGTKTDKFNGGGIFCEPGSAPTISYNVITQNRVLGDGGGIFINQAAPNIFNNIITQNSAGGSGGAIQCYNSIHMPGLSSSLPGGEGVESEGVESASKPNSASGSTESNSETNQNDLKNSLYPRDATEVFSTLSSDSLSRTAQDTNRWPVPVVKYYDKKTGEKKPKYFAGDTVVLDASKSYDPDSLQGDSIDEYSWSGVSHYDCKNPGRTKSFSVTDGNKAIAMLVIQPPEAQETGTCALKVRVRDAIGKKRVFSTDIVLNVQRRPTADAGDSIGVAPGDIAWLDASGSCDANPDDTTLSYRWAQILGPIQVDTLIDTTVTPPETTIVSDTLWVTLVDTSIIIDTILVNCDTTLVDCDTIIDTTTYSHPANPYFATKDSSSYLGEYKFLLQVCDSSSCGTDSVVVMCSHAPVAVCPPSPKDSLFGYAVGKPVPLDGSFSWDPDSALGDYVRYFIWEGFTLTTCAGTLKLSGIVASSSQKITYFYPQQGGIYKLLLSVKDKFEVRSRNKDTLVVSVQLRPSANAGRDTIVGPESQVYLNGDACELNWDQRDSLKYEWFQDPTNPTSVTFDPPDGKSRNVKFSSPKSSFGVFRYNLRVTDPYPYNESSWPDDTIKVINNALPQIDSIINRPGQGGLTVFPGLREGDNVQLTLWAHDDTANVRIFGDSLTFSWTDSSWPGSPDDKTYKPVMVGSKTKIMRFVPLKHGAYEFEVVVHDTLTIKPTPKQVPSVVSGRNSWTIKVMVDTTFAYPIIMGNLISSNTAGSKGGGVDCFQSSPDIVNNIFFKNKSGSSGGALSCRGSEVAVSTPLVRRNIFMGNISSDSTGGAIADLKAELSPGATIGFKEKMVVNTNDFWNNAGKDLYQPPADISNNIYTYPRLTDPEYGNFRLDCSSPCLKDSIGLLLWLYPDTCDTVPPLKMLSLSLFQNPVATAVAHFLVNTDVALEAPPVAYVSLGGNSPAPVYFTSISSTTYRGIFVFSTSGTAHISLFASSVQEVPDTLTRDFSVQMIGAGKIGKLVSHDNRLSVLFPEGTVKEEIYATCIPVSDDPQYKFDDEGKAALGEVYHLGPLLDFNKELTISFPLDSYDLTEKDKSLFSIYRCEKNNWEKQPSFLDDNSICAKVGRLGVYRLVYDATQEHIAQIPKTYQLSQNYPNPFNPQTMIKYDLPNPGQVNITVYNILGQKVKTLVDEYQEAGFKSVNWDGKDDEGRDAASGIYFYKIKTVGFEKTKKMVLLK